MTETIKIVEQKLASCVLISLASLKQKWLNNVQVCLSLVSLSLKFAELSFLIFQEHCKPGDENSLDCLLVRTNIEKLTRKVQS